MPEDAESARPAETRRLAAIMFTDIVGFSRQMGADEARMLRMLAVHNQVIEQAVAAHQGHVIKTAGDGFLVDSPPWSTPCSAPNIFRPSSETQCGERKRRADSCPHRRPPR